MKSLYTLYILCKKVSEIDVRLSGQNVKIFIAIYSKWGTIDKLVNTQGLQT